MRSDQFNGPIRGSLVNTARQPSSSVSFRSGSRATIRWVQFHVRRLQCVRVFALGQESLFAKFLFDALKAAKAKLNVPVGERLEACKKFLK